MTWLLLSHPTLDVGLKDDESDCGCFEMVGRNLVETFISITLTCFRSLAAVRMADDVLYLLS